MRQTSRNSSRPPSSDLLWDKASINNEDQHPQQGQDEVTGVDDHTLTPKKHRHLVVGMTSCQLRACGTDYFSGLPDATVAGANTGIPE